MTRRVDTRRPWLGILVGVALSIPWWVGMYVIGRALLRLVAG